MLSWRRTGLGQPRDIFSSRESAGVYVGGGGGERERGGGDDGFTSYWFVDLSFWLVGNASRLLHGCIFLFKLSIHYVPPPVPSAAHPTPSAPLPPAPAGTTNGPRRRAKGGLPVGSNTLKCPPPPRRINPIRLFIVFLIIYLSAPLCLSLSLYVFNNKDILSPPFS